MRKYALRSTMRLGKVPKRFPLAVPRSCSLPHLLPARSASGARQIQNTTSRSSSSRMKSDSPTASARVLDSVVRHVSHQPDRTRHSRAAARGLRALRGR